MNSKIYNHEDKKAFEKFEGDFKRLESYEITILDFLILLGNECFSNDNLINLNENFETEKSQNSNLTNLEFKIRSPDSIVALCERNDYSILKNLKRKLIIQNNLLKKLIF